MASGPHPPGGEPSGPSGSLIRHRWLTAAGTTATVAAMAGGGLALIQHPPAAGQHQDCGLVRCSATLPSSVASAGAGPARAPGSPRPAPDPARSADRAAGHAQAPEAAAGPGRSADHHVGVHYQIKPQPGRAVTGQLVIVNHGGTPVTGWRLRVVLPGDGHYQVAHAAGASARASAGDSLVLTALPGQPALGAGRSELIVFTAAGSTAVPASVTFQDTAGGQPAQAGSAAGRGRSGWPSRTGWPGGWWRGPQQHGYGGWPAPVQGGWPSSGPGGGWSGSGQGGWAGQGGWPGGR